MTSQSDSEMSGKRVAANKQRNYEIQLTNLFSIQMARLYLNDDYSDVTFIVENQRMPAHRVILATRSVYFGALLDNGMSESRQSEIKLEVPLGAFKALLLYIYSGHLYLSQMDEGIILDTLGLAHQYGLTELELAISDYLRQYLAVSNICAILDAAHLYNLENLTKVCLTFMDRNASELLQHESFKTLSKESLEEVLSRDSFFAPEVQIFLAVWEWCKQNNNVDINSVVSYVRLPLMNLEHLLQVVRPSGIINPDTLLDAIEEQNTSKYLPYRAALCPEENVCKYVSRSISGECRGNLLNGDLSTYDIEKGYTCHVISDLNENDITVELGTICIINHVKMLLWDLDNRSYSYFVEVSANLTQWDRVIDYTNYYCRSWQFMYFNARPVRYIKLVGTHNTVDKIFHVVALEAMHTAYIPKVINGMVAPEVNVATIEMCAVVVNGDSRTRNALLNGNYNDYDWDFGYTCHRLDGGEILVRLGQPYIIGSMRLLLWDCDDRTYSFYIETSVNQKDWVMVADMRNEQARSWQNLAFNPLPVVFIRIVGTRNTASEMFHCVHLECPSQDINFLLMEKEKQRMIEEDEAKELSELSGENHPSTSETTTPLQGGIKTKTTTSPNQPQIVEEEVDVQLDNISVNDDDDLNRLQLKYVAVKKIVKKKQKQTPKQKQNKRLKKTPKIRKIRKIRTSYVS